MSLMEAERCELCGANGHNAERTPYGNKGTDKDGDKFTVFWCVCCDRWDRIYKAFAEQHSEDTVRQKSHGLEDD